MDMITDAISEILYDFTETPDGDKQCFDIYKHDSYKALVDAGLDNCNEIRHLRIYIENIVNSWEELCNEFGDIF